MRNWLRRAIMLIAGAYQRVAHRGESATYTPLSRPPCRVLSIGSQRLLVGVWRLPSGGRSVNFCAVRNHKLPPHCTAEGFSVRFAGSLFNDCSANWGRNFALGNPRLEFDFNIDLQIMFGPLEKRRQKNKQCGRVCGAVFSTTPVVHKRARTNTHNCRSGASYGAMVRVVFVPIWGGKRESTDRLDEEDVIKNTQLQHTHTRVGKKANMNGPDRMPYKND